MHFKHLLAASLAVATSVFTTSAWADTSKRPILPAPELKSCTCEVEFTYVLIPAPAPNGCNVFCQDGNGNTILSEWDGMTDGAPDCRDFYETQVATLKKEYSCSAKFLARPVDE